MKNFAHGQNIKIALGAIALLWLIHLMNFISPVDLRLYGIVPRRINSLGGILITPLVHANIGHLIANSGALFVLLLIALFFSRQSTYVALMIIILGGGGCVWLLGKGGSVHIGASGIVFGLIGFLMGIGFFSRDWRAIAVSVIVFLLYGGALFSLLRYTPGTSWSGHFFGFLAGLAAAWRRTKQPAA
jgi:membrane associated rhomboid family serine protease